MATNHYIKGFLQDIVLQLIAENGKMYGYEITKKVQEISDGVIAISEGALYPVLHKLENQKKLTASFVEEEGRLRKYYQITDDGQRSLAQNLEDLSMFLSSLSQIFKPKTT